MTKLTSQTRNLVALACLTVTPAMIHATPKPTLVEDTFLIRDGSVAYTGRGWSVRSTGDLGWTSMKVGNDEFLFSTDEVGGFLFSDQTLPQDGHPPLFPDQSTISHDRMVGHLGLVGNGIHMIRFTADPQRDDNELYFGANSDTEGLTCTLFLSGEVKAIRVDDGKTVTLQQGSPVKTRKAVIMHRNGSSITIESTVSPSKDVAPPPFTVGVVEHPSGKKVLGITFDTPGFKANPFSIDFGSEPRTPSLLHQPGFAVTSSDDPEGASRFHGATRGVINPEYTPETELDYKVEFEWKGDAPFDGYAELEVIHAYGDLHYYERIDLKGKGPGKIVGKFDPQFTMPGVSDVWLRIVDGDGRMLWNDRYRMLYDRANFEPNLLVADDFEDFWQETLEILAQIPLDPKTERVERFKEVPGFEVYAVSFNGWEGKRIHAMLYVPREGERPLPAVVHSHPGTRGFNINKGPDGVYGSNLRMDPRFVRIIPLIRGHEIDAPDVPFNHPWWGPLENRDTYAARLWYTTMVRAIDYLATRPDIVDMDRIVADGGSQGGALAIVTTALDPRVAYCFSDCPSNAQAHEIMRYYEGFGPSRGIVPPGMTQEDAELLLSYYNPANFAPLIRVPTHVGINIGDLTVHSMGPLAIYQNLTGLDDSQKAFHPGFTHFHGSGPGLGRARRTVFDEIAGPLPEKK